MSVPEDVILLVRSILASSKDPMCIKQLNDEYLEMNGRNIPFREMGFATMLDFLQSEPDKVTLIRTATGYQIKPVIDASLAKLSQLVRGQKSKKKKKSSAAKKGYAPFKATSYSRTSSYAFNSYKSSSSYAPSSKSYTTSSSAFASASSFSQNNYKYSGSSGSYTSSYTSFANKATASSGGYVSRASSQRDLSNHTDYDQDQDNLKKTPAKPVRIDISQININTVVTNTADLWIQNAPYYLKEHEIEYDKMTKRLNEFYSQKEHACVISSFEPMSMCVAYDTSRCSYARVQIDKQLSASKIQCLFVDEGKTQVFEAEQLFVLRDQFLVPKFQSIMVTLHKMDRLVCNDYVAGQVEQRLLHCHLLARLEVRNPLEVSLYPLKATQSVNDFLLKSLQHFTLFKPVQGDEFSALITFIDEHSSLVYLQLQTNDRYELLLRDVNDYYNRTSSRSLHKLDSNAFSAEKVVYKRDELFCARYEVDNMWYRAKLVRQVPPDSVTAQFVDYGNREVIPLASVKEIAPCFDEFKSIPHQAFPVSVVTKSADLNMLKDCLYESEPVQVKIVRVNSTGIPSVELFSPERATNISSNSSNSHISSSSSSIGSRDPVNSNSNSSSSGSGSGTALGSLASAPSTARLSINSLGVGAARVVDCSIDKLSASLNRHLNIDTNTVSQYMGARVGSSLSLAAVSSASTSASSSASSSGASSAAASPRGHDSCSSERVPPVDLDAPVTLKINELGETNLPCSSFVYVCCATNPFNFVMNLESSMRAYELMLKSMQQFYLNEPKSHMVDTPIKDFIYVRRNSDNRCSRVKYIDFLNLDQSILNVQDIDTGKYNAISRGCLYRLTQRFMQLKPLAIRAQLANVAADLADGLHWSDRSRAAFTEMTKDMKVFRANIIKFYPETNLFKVELFDSNGSLSDRLIKANFAKPPAASSAAASSSFSACSAAPLAAN